MKIPTVISILMMKPSRISWLSVIHRNFSSRRSTPNKNHYESLEIKPKATHNEIKSAYFKLSKKYHPDKNSSGEAKIKFNDISEAYEVLGSHEKRKQYDRGLQIKPMSYEGPDIVIKKTNFTDITEEAKRVQAEIYRNLYQPDGKPIYDFDKWTENHYGRVFERKRRDLLDLKYHTNQRTKRRNQTEQIHRDSSILVIITSLFLFALIFFEIKNAIDMDTPMILSKDDENIKKDDAEKSES